jgi:hypothetical protein
MLKSVLPGVFCLILAFANAQNDSLSRKKKFGLLFGIFHSPTQIPEYYPQSYWLPKRILKLCAFSGVAYNIPFNTKFSMAIHYNIGLNRYATKEYFFKDSLPVLNNTNRNPFEYKAHSTFLYHSLGFFLTYNNLLKKLNNFSISVGLTTESYLIYFYKTLVFNKLPNSNEYSVSIYKYNTNHKYYFKQSNYFNLYFLNIDIEKKFKNPKYSLSYRFKYGYLIGLRGIYSDANADMFANSLMLKINLNN